MKDGIDLGDYRAPWWLPGGHAQTIWPITHAQALPAYRRERWDTPDGDCVDLDWLPTAKADAALVVLNATNDPFVPAAALPQVTDLAPAVHFAHPAEGGHVGFCAGAWPGDQAWLAQGLLAHFDAHY